MRKLTLAILLAIPMLCAAQYSGVITSAMLVPHGGSVSLLDSPVTAKDNPRWYTWIYTGGPIELDCHIEFSSSGIVDSVSLHLPMVCPLAGDDTYGVCYMESTVTGGNTQETCTWFLAKGTRLVVLHRQSPYPATVPPFATVRTVIQLKGHYH